MGPWSATIEPTSGACEARSSASNSLACTVAAPAFSSGRDLLVEPVGVARGQHHRRAGRQPPREFDADLAAAAENHYWPGARVIHGCDYLLR